MLYTRRISMVKLFLEKSTTDATISIVDFYILYVFINPYIHNFENDI